MVVRVTEFTSRRQSNLDSLIDAAEDLADAAWHRGCRAGAEFVSKNGRPPTEDESHDLWSAAELR
jgi:hypothetical protein